jgi:alkylated DNA repair dioxygenase AlkB
MTDMDQTPCRPAWAPLHVVLANAGFSWAPAFLAPAEAARLATVLRVEVPWSVHRICLFGRWVDSPRLSCWMGEAAYRYSGVCFEPLPWTPAVLALKARIEEAAGVRFNSVLLNRYRDGRDSMGWHSDNEPELGPEPQIASLSLGATRRFTLRRRDRSERHAIALSSGSLLLMSGPSQRDWRHALPKTRLPVGERINLTFRWIEGAPRSAARAIPG